MPIRTGVPARTWMRGVVLLMFAGWMAGCSSVLPDVVYQSPFVRVYPVEDSAAVPPKTNDRYLAKDELEAVDLDTVSVDMFGPSDRLRPYREVAMLHLVVSERMYAYDTGERHETIGRLLKQAAARVGGDAVVLLRQGAQREDKRPSEDARGRQARGNAWPGSADRSRQEWRDDWRERRRISVRAMAIQWNE